MNERYNRMSKPQGYLSIVVLIYKTELRLAYVIKYDYEGS